LYLHTNMQAVPVDDDDNNNNDSSVMPIDNHDHDDTTQRQIFANFAKLKQETNGSTVSERDRELLAHETARLIQLEVQRWEASVAELEGAVLQRQQQQQQPPNNNNNNIANVVFPTLPAVVDVIDDRSSHDHSPDPPTLPMSALSSVADLDDTTEDEHDDEMEEDHDDEEEEVATAMQ